MAQVGLDLLSGEPLLRTLAYVLAENGMRRFRDGSETMFKG